MRRILKKSVVCVFASIIVAAAYYFTIYDVKGNKIQAQENFSVESEDKAKKQIRESIKEQLELEKEKGKKWINSINPKDIVTVHITFNSKKSLEKAIKFSEQHNLDIKQWNELIDIGDYTYTGGYRLDEDETLEEATKSFNKQLKFSLQRQVEQMKRKENQTDLPEYGRNAAREKRLAYEDYLSKFSDNQEIIYGVTVQGESAKIRPLINQNEIKAVKKANIDQNGVQDGPLLPFLPANW